MSETTNVVDSAEAQEAFLSDVPNATEGQTISQQFVEQKSYTEDDLKRVREQEKSKLYPQIDSLKEEVNILKKEREERLAEEAARKAELEAEAKRQAEAELDTRQLLELKEKEWATKLEEERREREKAFLLLERERQHSELTEYRTRRINEEQDNIMPELLDLISGNTPDEIEASITGLRDRTAKILESAASTLQNARREMVGTKVSLPPVMENNSDPQQFTAEQIAAMSATEYAKHRAKLLGNAAQPQKGIFG